MRQIINGFGASIYSTLFNQYFGAVSLIKKACPFHLQQPQSYAAGKNGHTIGMITTERTSAMIVKGKPNFT